MFKRNNFFLLSVKENQTKPGEIILLNGDTYLVGEYDDFHMAYHITPAKGKPSASFFVKLISQV